MSVVAPKRLLTSGDVARLLGVSVDTVQHWARQGTLRAIRIGERGRLRFADDEIRRLLEQRGEGDAS
jgi:excisionase family DNA binding protein